MLILKSAAKSCQICKVTTYKRKYSSWKKGKTKRAKAVTASVAKIARQVVNSSGQPAYVTTYLSYSVNTNLYFNVAKKFEDFSELAHVSRGMFLDLSNCPNTGSSPNLSSGEAVSGYLSAQGVRKALYPASTTAPEAYQLRQHTSAVMDGSKYFQHSIYVGTLPFATSIPPVLFA
jgi:hypothetical protein